MYFYPYKEVVYLKNELPELFSVSNIVNFAYHKYPANFSFEGEQHSFWEFVFVDKGELIIMADDKKYVLMAGELAFHRPDECHAIENNGVSANAIVVAFDCKSEKMQYFNGKILSLDDKGKENLYEAVRYVKESFETYAPIGDGVEGMALKKNVSAGTLQLIKIKLEEMLIKLYQSNETTHVKMRMQSFERRNMSKTLSDKIKSYLEVNIMNKVTLKDVAKYCGYSVPYINRIFRDETGDSIINYTINFRLDEAKRLIQDGKYTFTQISEMLGFDNVNYFSHVFKIRVGMTPTEFSKSIGIMWLK